MVALVEEEGGVAAPGGRVATRTGVAVRAASRARRRSSAVNPVRGGSVIAIASGGRSRWRSRKSSADRVSTRAPGGWSSRRRPPVGEAPPPSAAPVRPSRRRRRGNPPRRGGPPPVQDRARRCRRAGKKATIRGGGCTGRTIRRAPREGPGGSFGHGRRPTPRAPRRRRTGGGIRTARRTSPRPEPSHHEETSGGSGRVVFAATAAPPPSSHSRSTAAGSTRRAPPRARGARRRGWERRSGSPVMADTCQLLGAKKPRVAVCGSSAVDCASDRTAARP